MMNASALSCELPQTIRAPEHSRRMFERCFGKTTTWIAWISLIAATFIPPKGIGISLCWMRGQLGIPCPGCGLTRSLSCAMRGMFYESWQFHPFGLFILALFVLTAMVSIMPEAQRSWLAESMEKHARFLRAVFIVFISAFCSYGLFRAIFQLTGYCQFSA